MVTLLDLWLPIVASAVAVFVLSSLVHMVFKWHNVDYRALANEDDVRTMIQRMNPAPGEYLLPHCPDMKGMQSPDMQQKFRDGPVALITLRRCGAPNMGRPLAQWFLYTIVVAVFAGYVASRVLPAGAHAARVLQVIATVAFMTYAGGSVQSGIWMGKPWRSVAKDALDALLYGLATGAVFGWLWPQ
jgi:hypothetical protein